VQLYEFREKAVWDGWDFFEDCPVGLNSKEPPRPNEPFMFTSISKIWEYYDVEKKWRADRNLRKVIERDKHQESVNSCKERAEEEAQNSKELQTLLQKGHIVLSYRKESIASISYTAEKGIEIRANEKAPAQVFFKIKEEAYHQVEPMIKDYLRK
jgi:hypothetical protein